MTAAPTAAPTACIDILSRPCKDVFFGFNLPDLLVYSGGFVFFIVVWCFVYCCCRRRWRRLQDGGKDCCGKETPAWGELRRPAAYVVSGAGNDELNGVYVMALPSWWLFIDAVGMGCWRCPNFVPFFFYGPIMFCGFIVCLVPPSRYYRHENGKYRMFLHTCFCFPFWLFLDLISCWTIADHRTDCNEFWCDVGHWGCGGRYFHSRPRCGWCGCWRDDTAPPTGWHTRCSEKGQKPGPTVQAWSADELSAYRRENPVEVDLTEGYGCPPCWCRPNDYPADTRTCSWCRAKRELNDQAESNDQVELAEFNDQAAADGTDEFCLTCNGEGTVRRLFREEWVSVACDDCGGSGYKVLALTDTARPNNNGPTRGVIPVMSLNPDADQSE